MMVNLSKIRFNLNSFVYFNCLIIQIPKNSSMKRLKQVQSFLNNAIHRLFQAQVKLQPILVLILVLANVLDFKIIREPSTYLFAITLSFLFRYNFFFLLSTWFYTDNIPLSLIFLAISVIFCNRKWKTYLFLFISLITTVKQSGNTDIVIFAASVFIVVVTYKNLMFDSFKDNYWYFIGFFIIALMSGISVLTEAVHLYIHVYLQAVIAAASMTLAQEVITKRIDTIKQGVVQDLRDPHLSALVISQLAEDLTLPYHNEVELRKHRKSCVIVSCFCKDSQEMDKYFLRQSYQNAIGKYYQQVDPLLGELYVNILLLGGQTAKALYFLSKWEPHTYFSWAARLLCEQKVMNTLKEMDNINAYEKEYSYALKYDRLCLRIATEITEVLRLKIQFWREVALEEPNLNKMQEIGLKTIDLMGSLNQLYGGKVKVYQRKLHSFDATALYLTYLMSATSFKDYSNQLLKENIKLMQNIGRGMNETLKTETFAIRTIVNDDRLTYQKKQEKQFLAEVQSIPGSCSLKKYQNNMSQVIVNVSSGFCRLIQVDQRDIIGRDLSYLIPQGYKEVHLSRLNYLLDFQSQAIKEIIPSRVFHRQLILPIKGGNNGLHFGYICIRSHIDAQNGLSFVSIIKKVSSKVVSGLLEVGGRLLERSKQFPLDILEHPDTKAYLHQLNTQWEQNKVIPREDYNIMMEGINYQVTLSSPLLGLFVEKQNLLTPPPIHIDIKNNKIFQKQIDANQPKFNQHLIESGRQSLPDRQSSVRSTEKSVVGAIQILSTFSENSSIPYYRYLILMFVFVMGLCIVANVAVCLYPSLEWNNSQDTANPVREYMSLYEIVYTGLRTEINIMDSSQYYNNLTLWNNSNINNYIMQASYDQSVTDIFKDTENKLRSALSYLLRPASTVFSPLIESILQKRIPVSNLGTLTVAKPSMFVAKQVLTYREIQMICLSDYNFLQLRKQFTNIMVTLFSSQVVPYIQRKTISSLTSQIDISVNQSMDKAKKFGIIIAFCVPLCLIPLLLILKKRSALHQRVFDLLTSVEVDDIQGQIKCLHQVQTITFNYRYNRQTLKNNLRCYEQNRILPQSETKSQSSVNNQMIRGLQNMGMDQVVEEQNEENDLLLAKQQKIERIDDHNDQSRDEVFKLIRKKLIGEQKGQTMLKQRRRMGELNASGSEYNSKAFLWGKNCFFYMTIIFLTLLVIPGILLNLDSTGKVIQTKESIDGVYNNIMSMHSQLKRVTLFVWQGSAGYIARYRRTTNVSLTLASVLDKLANFTTAGGQGTAFIAPCLSNESVLCQQISSIRLIEGQIQSIAQSLVLNRFNSQSLNPPAVSNSTDISERMFYLQSLTNKLHFICYDLREQLFQRMVRASKESSMQRYILLGMVIWLAVMCLVGGLVLIGSMKRKYLKEVYLLTFLNQTMILKNKRISSFLDKLAKNK